MKVAPLLLLSAGSMLDCSAADVVAHAAAAGFDGVGLSVSSSHASVDPHALAESAHSVGITIHDVEVFRVDSTESDPRELITAATDLGASYLLAVSDLTSRSETIDRFGQLSALCRDAGLKLAVEYMAWTIPNDPKSAIQIATAANCLIVVDLLHHHRVGAGVSELQSIVDSGLLGWVQVCDAPGVAPTDLLNEARHERLAPGDGQLPLARLQSVLPPETVISVEVQSDHLAHVEPGRRAQQLFQATRRLL